MSDLIPTPKEIGHEFRELRKDAFANMKRALGIGQMLSALKVDLKANGKKWRDYFEQHEQTLGFGRRQADRFIKASENGTLTSHVKNGTEISALEYSKQVWGNPPKKTKTVKRFRKGGKSPVVFELNSLSWANANHALRAKFVDSVGLRHIWKEANEHQREALREAILKELQAEDAT